MGLVVSLLLITVGAVMRFAVTATAEDFNVGTAGMILMLIGALGAVISIVFWASWGGFGSLGRRTVVTSAPPVVVQRTIVHKTESV